MRSKRKLEIVSDQPNTSNYHPNIELNTAKYLVSGEHIISRIQGSFSSAVLQYETRFLQTHNERFSNIFSYNQKIDRPQSQNAKRVAPNK